MNKKTKKALKGSIKKWQKIYNFLKYKRRYTERTHNKLLHLESGINNCPLCELFYKIDDVTDSFGCHLCPVKNRTGYNHCKDSPYYEFRHRWYGLRYGSSLSNLKKYAKKELDFLKTLREYE